MTWVIGRAGPFGHAIGLSDIRVTLQNGKEVDCLQKIYNIAPKLVLGFAGSVAIGFEIVNQLSEALYIEKENLAWNPLIVAESLDIGTRQIFKNAAPFEKKLGCQLILLSVDPNENDGAAPWARCYVHRFLAPEFRPLLAKSKEIVSIGSGAKNTEYSERLSSLENDLDLLKLETGMRGGSGLGLMMYVSSLIRKKPTKGISRHLQICIVGRDGTKIGNNDITRQERPEDNFLMPRVAQNLNELQKILISSGISKSAIEQAQC